MNAETVAPPDIPVDEQPTLIMPPGVRDPRQRDPANPPDPNDPSEQPTVVMQQPDEVANNEPPAPAAPTLPSRTEPREPTSPDSPSEIDEDLAHGLRLGVVDTSHGVVTKSADYADAYLAEQTTQKGFKGFLKKIWHGNLARDFKRVKKVQEGRQRIVESGNLGELQNGSRADHEREMSAVVTRVTDGYLHSGERQDRLSDTGAGEDLENGLRVLIRHYAAGALDDETLNEEKTRILNEYKTVLHKEDRNKGLLMADNVLEVARNARAALDHGIAIERIMSAIDARSAEAKIGQRTEARREMTDKIVDKLYGTKAGSLVNETTIALVAGAVQTFAKVTTRKLFTAAAATVTLGAGAGAIAGAREHARVGQERQQHIRERAVGQETPRGEAERRVEMEETRYSTVAATELTDQLAQAREAVNSAEPASIQQALGAISEAETRIRISDERAMDLIDFTGANSVEQERLQLDIALAQAKVSARRALGEADEGSLQGAGLTRDLDEALTTHNIEVSRLLGEDISAKDAAFSTLRRNRTLKMAAVGFVMGETIGLGVQEARAALSDSLQGVFDSSNGHVDRQTLLAAVMGHGSGHHAANEVLNIHDPKLNQHASLDLPSNFHVERAGTDHWNILGPDGKPVINGLSVNAHGHLTEASREALLHAGYHLTEQKDPYTTHNLVKHTFHRTPEDFLRRHPGDFTHVNRELWYDNNTPNIFDKNELKLWWGGNNGMDQHGNYVFNVAQMTPDGSFHDGLSADAQNLIHEGKMAIALSMTQGTQSHVVMIPIDTHGNAVIKGDSWMAHSMFEMKDGHAQFNGAYAEAVQLMGKHHGMELMRMLATAVGSNNPHNIVDVVHHLATHHHERIITHILPPEGAQHPPIEIPPPLPIYARRGLEMPQVPATPYGYGYGHEEEGEDWEKAVNAMVEERSPRLVDNPEATLNPAEELSWYRDKLEKRLGRDKLERLEASINASPELRDMSGDVETIVTVPVAAIQEADTLYDSLSLYGKQLKESLEKSLILLNLNWLDTAASKRGGQNGIEKARKAIERARKDFPDLKVAVVENEYKQEAVEATGGVIGYVAADLMDTALLAVQQRMQSGGMSPGHEVLIIRNDADPEGTSRNYLESYQNALNDPKNKDIDVLKGVTRFGVRWADKYPGFAVASNFAAALAVQLSARGLPATGGANFGIKASMLAAVGGLGTMTHTGAGSDDGALGRRIRLARWGVGVFPRGSLSQETVLPSGKTVPYRTVAAHVTGATVDTNPSRLVPYYLRGRSYSNAWGPDFSNGQGGYRDRLGGTQVTPNGRSEIANDWDVQFRGIEETISSEMHWNGVDDIQRVLSIFFGHIPGSYTVSGEIGTGSAQFKLTDVGKQYLRKRFEQEGYGKRLRQNKYGSGEGAVRAPLLSAV